MKEKLLIGTYTRRISKGIYSLTLDTEQKKLSPLTIFTEEKSPTYLALSNDHQLITVGAVGEEGALAAYQIDENEQTKHLNSIAAPGAAPCYVAIDEQRQLVFGANYHKGEITVYQKTPQGLVLTETIKHGGNGPLPQQTSAHVHFTDLTPDKRLVVCDLGTDQLFTYDVSNDGKLTEKAVLKTEPGFGPRHIAFHPNGKMAYLFGELSSLIAVLKYDPANGSFEMIETISTLPEGYEGFNGGAAIRISNDGRFLYASNRGNNSIVSYTVSEDGTHLETLQHISSYGDFPRDFNLDPTEKFIVLANQNSDNLTLYGRDTQSGLLSLIEEGIFCPEGVCVKFF